MNLPTQLICCITAANAWISRRKIALLFAYNEHGSQTKVYHSKKPWSFREYIKTWLTRLKRWQDSGHPWQTPCSSWNFSVNHLLCLTINCALQYKVKIQETKRGGKPICSSKQDKKVIDTVKGFTKIQKHDYAILVGNNTWTDLIFIPMNLFFI